MPRRHDRKQLSTTVTAEQHAVAKMLAGAEGLNAYIRRLVAQDAAAREVEWSDNLPGPGQRATIPAPPDTP